VEDDPAVRAYTRDALAATYRVEEAADGAAGLARAEAVVPDLVVADVMMPAMDGYALCRALKAHPALDHVPVLMLTAKAEPEHVLEGLEAEADAYVRKPFNERELRARVATLLANRARLRQRFERAALAAPDDGPAATEAAMAGATEAEAVDVDSADARFVRRAREAVEAHLADEDFDVDAFAEAVGLSRRQLQRKLKAVTGETPTSFVRLIRLSRGAQLVAQGYGTVAEIAYAVGFGSPSYFTKCFRETYGVPPTEYAAEERGTATSASE
jgi:DNA-binding response OmpR family regulator